MINNKTFEFLCSDKSLDSYFTLGALSSLIRGDDIEDMIII